MDDLPPRADAETTELSSVLAELQATVVTRVLARRGLYLKPKAVQQLVGCSYERCSARRVPLRWLDLRRSWRAVLGRWFV